MTKRVHPPPPSTWEFDDEVASRMNVEIDESVRIDPFEFPDDIDHPPSTKPSRQFEKSKQGKLRWALLPINAVREVVRVFEFGAKKHSEFGWRGVPNAKQFYYESCMRHLTDWYWDGLDEDPESGLHPLAHLGADTLILLARKLEGTLD